MKIAKLMALSIGVIFLSGCGNTDIGIIGGADGPTSVYIYEKDDEVQKQDFIEDKIVLKKTLAPTGFAGSSLNRIDLYSNGDVYWIQYDGDGMVDENMVKNELIAQNAEDIQMWEEEGISVVGENVKAVGEANIGWLKIGK